MRVNCCKAFVAAGLLCSTTGARADTWTYVAQGTSGYQAYINDQRSLRIGDVVEAWIKFVWLKPNSDGATSSTMLHRLDCAHWTDTLLSYIDYGPDGKPIDVRAFQEGEREETPVAPETTMDSVINYACSLPERK
jgi:sarcosine oxidase delta subunit